MPDKVDSAPAPPRRGVSRRRLFAFSVGPVALAAVPAYRLIRWLTTPRLNVVVERPFPEDEWTNIDAEDSDFVEPGRFVLCEKPGRTHLGVSFVFRGPETDPPRQIEVAVVLRDAVGTILAEDATVAGDARVYARERVMGFYLFPINHVSFEFDPGLAERVSKIEMRFREV